MTITVESLHVLDIAPMIFYIVYCLPSTCHGPLAKTITPVGVNMMPHSLDQHDDVVAFGALGHMVTDPDIDCFQRSVNTEHS